MIEKIVCPKCGHVVEMYKNPLPTADVIVDINGKIGSFHKGKTDDDRRYGALAYGFKVGNIETEQALKEDDNGKEV